MNALINEIRLPLSFGEEKALPTLQYVAESDRLNHGVFRFPAKFHPGVAKALVEQFTSPGATVLDPFCGSGSILVECATAGRTAIGTDVDPLAVLVTTAKTSLYDIQKLKILSQKLEAILERKRADDIRDNGSFEDDISLARYHALAQPLRPLIPEIDNIFHWFRRRVIIQLAAIKQELTELHCSKRDKRFFWLCFSSIIRNSSNADPVPVSGLEVTKHMLKKEEEGRSVDPYTLLINAVRKNLSRTALFLESARPSFNAKSMLADATALPRRHINNVDTVITSPPYLTAVDYYRRHQLEMFWLDLVSSQNDRLKLLPQYIGRPSVSLSSMKDFHKAPLPSGPWSGLMPTIGPEKGRAILHYANSMRLALHEAAAVTKARGRVVVVIGDSKVAGTAFPTNDLMVSLAPHSLVLRERFWYPLENRYMSYSRHNGADIGYEWVLVFEKT